jgi:hypothetical protein
MDEPKVPPCELCDRERDEMEDRRDERLCASCLYMHRRMKEILREAADWRGPENGKGDQ